MALYFHHYLPVTDTISRELYDRLVVLSSVCLNICSPTDFKVSILGTPECVHAIVVSGPVSWAEEERSKIIVRANEHMLSCLRLCFDPAADIVHSGHDGRIMMYQETDDPDPKFPATYGMKENPDFRVDGANIIGVFAETLNEPDIMALLGEGLAPAIPLHYRALSLFRALELLFNDRQLRAWCDRYEEPFAALQLSNGKLYNDLNRARTKWAHGRPSTGIARLFRPDVGLTLASTEKLVPLVNLMRTMVVDAIRERHGYDVRLYPEAKAPRITGALNAL